MTLWRYVAIPLEGDAGHRPVSGLLSAASPTEAGASLRRIGLQPLRLRRALRRSDASLTGVGPSERRFAIGLSQFSDQFLRTRRTARRAELIDSLATMLSAGLPLPEALLTASRSTRSRSLQQCLAGMRESLGDGDSLGRAMAAHTDWFDGVECAMVAAAEASGELSQALHSIGRRLDRRATGASRLFAILAYPALVLCVAIGVIVFLGTRTLPELAVILQGAGIPLPRLTTIVMATSAWLAAWGWSAALGAVALAIAWTPLCRSLPEGARRSMRVRWRLARTLAVGEASRTLADLLGAGVPLVEAIRTTAPSTPPGLAGALRRAADAVERGSDLSCAFDDPHWFNAETVRVLGLAQTAGDLGAALGQLADRNERRADRAMTLLATMLEPALILLLAGLVGLVVMSAILPILRLQEAI